jgi:hypothetical protein
VLQFFNNAGAGGITLSYSGPGVAKQIVPAANLSYANGDVHYVIDWGDGSAQERYPLFGNVSPSSVQNVSHTFTSAGSKTIQVRAVAENGIQSPWETLEVNCADCSHVPYCIGDNLWYRNESCTNVFVESCSFGCGGGSCSAIPESTVNINAGSSLVRSGGTVVITWSAEDVKSCTVSENNPGINDSWSCTGSQCVFQSQTSSPISAPTIYTLSCTGVDDNTYIDTVTVGVVPIFEEL